MDWAVLRIHAWFDEGGDDVVWNGPIIAYGYGEGGHYDTHHSDLISGEARTHLSYVDADDNDEFEIVPPEEWTDEMCAAIALKAMGITEGDE